MRVTTLARRLGSAALVAGLALGAAGCSDDSSSGTDSAGQGAAEEDGAEPSASEEATDEESAAEEPSAEAPAELSAEDFYPTVIGALSDAETFAFETTTDVGGQTTSVTGQGRYTDGGMEMKASSTGAQAMDMILVDQVFYMKAPQLGLGDKWVKFALDGPGGSLFGMLAKATDPESMFKAMETPKRLEVVGTEEINGVATNHYRITVDAADYVEAMEFPAEMASYFPDEFVSDMWVDGDGRPHKYSQTIEIPAQDGGKSTTSTNEGTYHDYGIEVDIEAPPASEGTDAPALPDA